MTQQLVIRIIAISIIAIAIFARFKAIELNSYPHGDIFQEIAVASQLFDTKLFALPYSGAVLAQAAHLTDKVIISDKPPLWPVLTALTAQLTSADTYATAKQLSFLFGLLSLPLFYLCARQFADKQFSLLALLIFSSSYLMIDFSGNGSRYMIQTILVLLFLLSLSHPKPTPRLYVSLTGFITGLLFLINYTTILFLVAIPTGLYLRRQLTPTKLFIAGIVFVLTISPWILYNYLNYHTPLLATNLSVIASGGNIFVKEGRAIYNLVVPDSALTSFLTSVPKFFFYNSIFLVKKIQILLPIIPLLFFFLLGKRKSLLKNNHLILLSLILIHLLAFNTWRVLKFRYLVSLYPLLLLLGLVAIDHLNRTTKRVILSVTLILTVAISISIYFQNPYHTYYYDGVFTEDKYRGNGEIDHMNKLTKRAAFSKGIPESVVATTLDRAYFLSTPAYLHIPTGDRTHFQEIIDTYHIQYLWLEIPLEPDELNRYPELNLVRHEKGEYLYAIN